MKKLNAIIFIVFLLVVSGCVKFPDEVIAPSWDTDFNIPITNKTYKLADILKPQKYIDIDSDSNYIFSSDTHKYSTGVSEYLDKSADTVTTDFNDVVAENTEFDVYLPFPGEIKLSKAVFKEGLLNFHASNHSNTEDITINMRIPGIKDSSGKNLSSQLKLTPGNSGSINTTLNGYEYLKPESQPSSSDNGLLIKVTASSVSNTAIVDMGFISSGFIFKSVTGYIPAQALDPFTNETKLELGKDISNYRGNIYLAGALLKLKAEYLSVDSNPFELELNNLQITGQSFADNHQEQLLFKKNSIDTSPASSTVNIRLGTVDTTFNESNSSINDFVSFLPDELNISTSPIMNPDNDLNYKTVTDRDSIKIESFLTTKGIDLNSNALLSLKKSSLRDTVELNIDQSGRDALSDGKAADISIQVKNSIPLTSWIKIILTDSSYQPLTTITTGNDGIDSLQFSGAQVNSSNGKVISASQSDQTLNLNSSQIQGLANAYYAILSVSLETSSSNETSPARVLLKASDWVEIRATGRIKYNINPGN